MTMKEEVDATEAELSGDFVSVRPEDGIGAGIAGAAAAGPDEGAAEAPAGLDGVLLLPASLDFKAAAPLAASLLDRRGADVTLDAAAVHRLGGLCLQVLLSAQASWAEDARSLRVADPSPDFLSAIELFGVPPELFLNQKEPA